jgi:hypothetical protein
MTDTTMTLATFIRLAQENVSQWEKQVAYNQKMRVSDPVHNMMLDSAKARLAKLRAELASK